MTETWYETLKMEMGVHPRLIGDAIWEHSHDILHRTYKYGQIPRMFPLADKSWECFILNMTAEVYAVDDLEMSICSPDSVLPVDSEEVRPDRNEIMDGVVETTDEDDDEYLYMAGPSASSNVPQ